MKKLLFLLPFLLVGVYVAGYQLTKDIPAQVQQPITISPTPKPTNTPTPKPAVKTVTIPEIECVGPDGVHFQTTQKECDEFNAAWDKPKPTPETPQPILNPPTTHQTTKNPPCTIYYPALGYSQTYSHLSIEECQKSKDEIANIPTLAPIPSYDYTYPPSDPVYIYWHPNPFNPTPGYGFHNWHSPI